ncbi:MAG TPA: asparagine synthase (glutamine-hydrolyzing) [Aggregatilineales bacterium]|nr:asparagine synthase (glutamine-hydrolyzing) [Aggregatilineales bacterium]
MCGIVGLRTFDSNQELIDSNLIERMRDTMLHRGPDGAGVYRDACVALGQRRLSIVDLAGGAQPMSDADELVWVLNNGEIYNHLDIRRELESQGYHFRTDSDTEAIVQGYLAYGEGIIERLRGMFALVIWDTRTQKLILARDRVGLKPLYYHHSPNYFAFASEIKALLLHPDISRELDFQALADYFTYLWIPEPLTIFRDIQKLPPGHKLVCHADGNGKIEISRYWRWNMAQSENRNLRYEDALEALRFHIEDAVKVRLMSDVPLGALLSGGVDSSAVVAMMARNSSIPVRTFSIGFEVASHDEREYAREVAQFCGTEHHELIVTPEAIDEVLPKLAHQYDEPFADASMLPTYYVCKMARQHVTVALGGDGGDEVFAGYDRYRKLLYWSRYVDKIPLRLRQMTLGVIDRVTPQGIPGKRPIQLFSRSLERRYEVMLRRFQHHELAALLTPDVFQPARPILNEWMEGDAWNGMHYQRKMQQADLELYLPAGILVKVDRASMLNSLEVRAPLIDHVLLDFVATLPHEWHLKPGTLNTGKAMFKDAIRGLVPERVLTRPKSGFRVPIEAWFKGNFADFLRGVLLSSEAQNRGYLNPATVKTLINRQASGIGHLPDQLWALLMFELWARQYLD